MKYFIQAMIYAFACMGSAYAADNHAAADAAKVGHESTQVCVDVTKDGKPVIDPKTKKPKQNCKQVKQHKKLEVSK